MLNVNFLDAVGFFLFISTADTVDSVGTVIASLSPPTCISVVLSSSTPIRSLSSIYLGAVLSEIDELLISEYVG